MAADVADDIADDVVEEIAFVKELCVGFLEKHIKCNYKKPGKLGIISLKSRLDNELGVS